jgi:ABC-type sugar transport system, periplasmic component
MKKNLFRIIATCLILTMAISVLTACGKKEGAASTTASTAAVSQQAATTTAKQLDEYKITALFPGDTPIDFAEVIAEAEKEVKDTLNVKLDFQFIPWTDYDKKVMVKMTAGDDLDLHLNAPWMSMNQMISNNMIQAWDDYLAKDGAAVLSAFPKQMIDSNKFNGKIMGIPLGNVLSAAKTSLYPIRGDLREKYGMAPIKSYDELEQYFLKVKENEKGMIPATWNASQFTLFLTTDANYLQFGQNNAAVIIPFNQDGTVKEIKPIYEYQGFIDMVKMMRKWYQEGIIDKDILVQKDGKGAYLSGKAAYSNVDFVEESKLQGSVPGAKMEKADVHPEVKPVSDFKMWNFLCLNAKCKNPERVAQWYNWIFEDQSHYDLLQYGIKGKHWIDTGKGTYDLPKGVDATKNYTFPGYVLLWNPNFDRIAANASQAMKDENAFCKNPDNYVQSALTGFTPDYEPIKNEIAKVGAIWSETIFTLTAGVVDPDKGLATAKSKLEAAGYLKIVEEAKKQIETFIAANKK